MALRKWTKETLIELHRLRSKEGLSWNEVAKKIGKGNSKSSVTLRYKRTNWDEFLADPDSYLKKNSGWRPWSDEEMIRLDAYLQDGKSYSFIAEKLNRRLTSIERQAQNTDWKAWRTVRVAFSNKKGSQEDDNTEIVEQLIHALLTISRYDFDRVKRLDSKKFCNQVNFEESNLPISFSGLKKLACEELINLGFGNPENVDLGTGTYVIVGDSHGKHTNKGMFKLLRQVNKILKIDKIIHIGHITDDDNDISYDWGKFDNLIVLAKIEELKITQEQRNKFNFNYDIVRGSVNLGDLVVQNQDIIADYARTCIKNLDSEIFDEKAVVNCHRIEFVTRCVHGERSYLSSPGCICENHIIKTIKQIDFDDGRIVKQAYWDGFTKYRRMQHWVKYWNRGMLIVHVDKAGYHTIIPCSIKLIEKGDYATSYFDKIITSKGVRFPERKIFINCDAHCDMHDSNILDIQEQVCKAYKPTSTVNLGDSFNYSSLNHHAMDRGEVLVDQKFIDECAHTYFVLKRMASWCNDHHIICGNHERFAHDFVAKYPQFRGYLDIRFVCDLKELGYKITDLKKSLKIGSATFIHGDLRMYGQTGNKLEKASRTFKHDVFIGHIHYPSIRFGCYSVGLAGKLDQEYNEPESSNWLHGFGLCNQYRGRSWSTTVAIVKNRCIINGKSYRPVKPANWKEQKYTARLSYQVK